ncbi:MAG TPA: hypothetical protein VHM89_13755 [Acidimicrobiales bacterium]|nr:hypothetical protein [Acidimicrobiales bacterium]
MKRLITGLGAVAVAAGVWAGGAHAAVPVGGCPTDAWELRASPSHSIGSKAVDLNGDGLSCWLEAPAGSNLFTTQDNVVPVR